MSKHSLYLITGNAKKLQEFKQILGDEFDFKNENVDLPELQGDPQLVAKQKVKIAYEQTKKAVLVQDTSLCFNAYKGLPGPYIKWFLKSIEPEGLAKMVQPFEDKTGYAMCIIAYMAPQLKEPVLFIGKTPGKIVEPRGSRDFGWDPVFEPDGYDKTYAQLPKQIKNTISHRFKAIDEMRKYFNQHKTQNKPQVKPERKGSQNKQQPKSEKKNQTVSDKKVQPKSQKKNEPKSEKKVQPKSQKKTEGKSEKKSQKKHQEKQQKQEVQKMTTRKRNKKDQSADKHK